MNNYCGVQEGIQRSCVFTGCVDFKFASQKQNQQLNTKHDYNYSIVKKPKHDSLHYYYININFYQQQKLLFYILLSFRLVWPVWVILVNCRPHFTFFHFPFIQCSPESILINLSFMLFNYCVQFSSTLYYHVKVFLHSTFLCKLMGSQVHKLRPKPTILTVQNPVITKTEVLW